MATTAAGSRSFGFLVFPFFGFSVAVALLVVTVSGKIAAEQLAPQAPFAESKAGEAATLQQVNTYLLQTIAKLRQAQQELQAKVTTLTETNKRLGTAAQDAQRKTQQANRTLQRLQADHRALTEEARALKGQAQHSQSLEEEITRLRQALVAAQEELEQLRRLHTQLTQGELKTLREETLTLHANLTALTEETRQRDQAMQELVAKLQQAQQLVQEHTHFKLEADTLRETLQRDRGELYRELGALYTKAQLFDRAINAYQKSLEANPDHAQTHYYLGLLYQHAKNNDERAVAHLQRSLALNPTLRAKERKDIEYVINMLQTKETAPSKEREPKPQAKP